MFYLKACPKCAGDLYLEKDLYRTYRKCFQCSRMFEVQARQPALSKRKPDKLAA